MSDFDSSEQKQRRVIRRDAGDEGGATQVGFVTDSGDVEGWRGDDEAPWTEPLGRASSDGSTGLTTALNGENQRIAVDDRGRLWMREVPGGGGTIQVHHDAAVVEQVQAFSGAGRVFQIRAILDGSITADRFAQIHDSVANPVIANAEPIWEGLIPGASTVAGQYAQMGDDFEPIGGLVLSTGCRLVVSTTPGVYTSPGADEVIFELTYET